MTEVYESHAYCWTCPSCCRTNTKHFYQAATLLVCEGCGAWLIRTSLTGPWVKSPSTSPPEGEGLTILPGEEEG